MFPKSFTATILVLMLSGCSGTARTPEHLANVEVGKGSGSLAQTPATAADMATTATTFGERFDSTAEQEIGTSALKAWRVATKHAKKGTLSDSEWKKLRLADEKESVAQLNDLQKLYPTASTVRFMLGQVKDHFGRHSDAVGEFRASIENNTNNGMYLFKLAETEVKAGQFDSAIKHYRLLIQHTPNFAPAELGLARALMKKDPKSAEAAALASRVLKAEPDNQEAKELINRSADRKPAS